MDNFPSECSFRFIHAADIHLDSPLKALSGIEGSPAEKIRDATRQAFVGLVDTAISHSVDFIILSGDIFDREVPSSMSRRFFLQQMSRLCDSEIGVYIIWGNHDAKNATFKKKDLPQNIHCFSSAAAESIALKQLPVVIHGQSYEDNAVTNNLVLLYPTAVDRKFNIGILHTSLDGYEGYSSYAPCSVQNLRMKGYDYWALGHIHKRQEVSQDPHIIYPGNTQGRHINESGAKGCLMVDVQGGVVQRVDFHPLDHARWEILEVDISHLTSLDALVTNIQKSIEASKQQHAGRFLITRLHLSGFSPLHWKLHADMTDLRDLLDDAFYDHSHDFWLEDIKLLTKPVEEIKNRKDALGDLVAALEQVSTGDDSYQWLMTNCSDLIEAVPEKVRSADSLLNAFIAGQTEEFLHAVKNFVIAQILSSKENMP